MATISSPPVRTSFPRQVPPNRRNAHFHDANHTQWISGLYRMLSKMRKSRGRDSIMWARNQASTARSQVLTTLTIDVSTMHIGTVHTAYDWCSLFTHLLEKNEWGSLQYNPQYKDLSSVALEQKKSLLIYSYDLCFLHNCSDCCHGNQYHVERFRPALECDCKCQTVYETEIVKERTGERAKKDNAEN